MKTGNLMCWSKKFIQTFLSTKEFGFYRDPHTYIKTTYASLSLLSHIFSLQISNCMITLHFPPKHLIYIFIQFNWILDESSVPRDSYFHQKFRQTHQFSLSEHILNTISSIMSKVVPEKLNYSQLITYHKMHLISQ